MSIETFPRKEVLTVDPETSVEDLTDRMNREDIGFVVVTEDGKPTGTVSDRDLAMGAAGDGAQTASDVMNTSVVTADTDAEIFDVIDRMSDTGVRRLVAVDESGAVDGIVTLDDFIVLLAHELGRLSDVVESQVPDYEDTPGDEGTTLTTEADSEPADLVTVGAAASVLFSLYEFYIRGNEKRGIFIGHWAPTILSFATYLQERRN